MSVSRRFGSVSKAKAAIRKGGGANGPLRRLKDGDANKLIVRYLQQPGDWEVAKYHYIDETFVWCLDPDKKGPRKCEHCEGGSKSSQVILSNVLDVKENKVIIIQMAKTLADAMFRYYEKFSDTVMDRDYELSREGSGPTDTRYFAIPEGSRMKRDLTRYKLYDIGAMIYADMGEDVPEDEAAPEDEAPRSSKYSSPRRTAVQEDEEEEEDFEEDEEESPYADLSRAELKAEIKKYDPDYAVKKSQTDDALREVLTDLANDEDEDADEDDEEEEGPYDNFSRAELKLAIREFQPDFTAKKSQDDEDLREIIIGLSAANERAKLAPKKKSRDAEDEFRPKTRSLKRPN